MTQTQERAMITATNGEQVPTLNIPLIRKLIGWAEEDEAFDNMLDALRFSTWDQNVWARNDYDSEDGFLRGFVKSRNICGTAHCQAGAAVVEADYRLLFEGNEVAETCVPIKWTGAYDERGLKIYDDVSDEAEDVEDVARRLMGFTEDEAYRYFDADQSIADLVSLANEFAAGRGMQPIFFNKDGSPCEPGNVDR